MKEVEKIVIATGNPAKVSYYREVFTEVVSVILGLDSFEKFEKPTESGKTAEENAETTEAAEDAE